MLSGAKRFHSDGNFRIVLASISTAVKYHFYRPNTRFSEKTRQRMFHVFFLPRCEKEADGISCYRAALAKFAWTQIQWECTGRVRFARKVGWQARSTGDASIRARSEEPLADCPHGLTPAEMKRSAERMNPTRVLSSTPHNNYGNGRDAEACLPISRESGSCGAAQSSAPTPYLWYAPCQRTLASPRTRR